MNLTDRVRIKISELNLEWLARHPAWSWFPSSPFEAEDNIYPVDLRRDNLSRLHTLFISSMFTTIEGLQFYGSITLDLESQKVYGIELFDKDENFGFNSELPDLAQIEINRLKAFRDNKHIQIFPISYKTLVGVIPGEAVLSGSFSIRSDQE